MLIDYESIIISILKKLDRFAGEHFVVVTDDFITSLMAQRVKKAWCLVNGERQYIEYNLLESYILLIGIISDQFKNSKL